MYNRTALEFWEEPVAMLRHNCIAGNTEIGAATVFEGPGIQVDARENWWGHASGPEHPSNPGGRGDRATGQLQVADHLVMDNCFLDLATDLIGPGGGSASTSSGNTSLAVPAGALSSDTRIALRPMGLSSLATMPAPLANGAGLRLFQVAGSRASDGAPVSELGAEAELTVAYSEAERLGIDEDTLAIYRLDTGQQAASGTAAGDTRVSVTGALDGASWTLLTGELDPDGNVLTAHTSSLGTFVVIGEREEVHICLPLVATRVW